MGIVEKTKLEAHRLYKTIVLPEGEENRMLDAAAEVLKQRLAKLILIGDESLIKKGLKNRGAENGDYTIINHLEAPELENYINIYYNLRKDKSLSMDEAREHMRRPVFYAAMLVRKGLADGSVAGSTTTTALVLQAGLRLIGVREGIKTISSSFIMGIHDKYMMFGDCAVNPEPTAEMLSDIAISTAESCRSFLHEEPYVAMLSFSTKGSMDSPASLKVREATQLVKNRRPDINIDGELQLDAAVVPAIAERKAAGSSVAGKANVLIFPDLNSGNIGYKLVERFAGAEAIGPVVQGFKRAFNDLSRGVSPQEIVSMVAFTAIQSELNI